MSLDFYNVFCMSLLHVPHSHGSSDMLQARGLYHFALLHNFNLTSRTLFPHNLPYGVHSVPPFWRIERVQLLPRQGASDFGGTDGFWPRP